MFNGKIHYKWPFSIAMLNYQRVSVVTRDISCYEVSCPFIRSNNLGEPRKKSQPRQRWGLTNRNHDFCEMILKHELTLRVFRTFFLPRCQRSMKNHIFLKIYQTLRMVWWMPWFIVDFFSPMVISGDSVDQTLTWYGPPIQPYDGGYGSSWIIMDHHGSSWITMFVCHWYTLTIINHIITIY